MTIKEQLKRIFLPWMVIRELDITIMKQEWSMVQANAELDRTEKLLNEAREQCKKLYDELWSLVFNGTTKPAEQKQEKKDESPNTLPAKLFARIDEMREQLLASENACDELRRENERLKAKQQRHDQ